MAQKGATITSSWRSGIADIKTRTKSTICATICSNTTK